ncbi:MAG: futalosine hydrolase [Planctomycetota bacterium]
MKVLILTPTQLELDAIKPLLSRAARQADGIIELCGFGPVAAAARAMQLIAMHQPTRVILVGIAGSLRPELAVGTARSFLRVRCDGIGAGTGADFKSASEIGWKHWGSKASAEDEPQASIGDAIHLQPRLTDGWKQGGDLLTVCAASASEADVAMRWRRYPDAVAEDMEGFGVAVACHFGAASLEIIRGISNRAGDRDKSNWDIDGALRAACELTLKSLSG